MLQKPLQLLAKPFIGSGIGQKLPWLHELYKKLYASGQAATFVARIPLGLSLEVQSSDTGPGLYLAVAQAYEPFETELFLQSLKKNDCVLDVGSHVGYYTVLAAKSVGAKGKVIAVEASPSNAQLLQNNLCRNKLKNVTVIQKAASNKSGTAQFFLSPNSSGDHSLAKQKQGQAISLTTTSIDHLCKQHAITPSVIKIDVEGAEELVLAGMTATLKRSSLRALFLEITPNASDAKKIITTLERANFTCHIIDEYKTQLKPYSSTAFQQVAKRHGFVNVLAQRN